MMMEDQAGLAEMNLVAVMHAHRLVEGLAVQRVPPALYRSTR
jgi:hypothetical protein